MTPSLTCRFSIILSLTAQHRPPLAHALCSTSRHVHAHLSLTHTSTHVIIYTLQLRENLLYLETSVTQAHTRTLIQSYSQPPYHTHTDPISPLRLPLSSSCRPGLQGACSLVDEPVADLTGQEDVGVQPQGLLVQQVAQGAVQIAQAEVGAEGHEGLGSVGRHAGDRQLDHSRSGPLGAAVRPQAHRVIGKATAWQMENKPCESSSRRASTPATPATPQKGDRLPRCPPGQQLRGASSKAQVPRLLALGCCAVSLQDLMQREQCAQASLPLLYS